ncbi:hypothetical protein C1752_07281 [Acaryochloris thomasi RCC1774]|uniref:Uncharacterized protein n=1 Tax=Acaryochloris thomasi RCC1774 TaxID=1764569 RepID=A0A2W1JB41_9CYAN|nr:hypothetical protein [Acaryochloris thomasi]PZD71303.1 hypothetical protein C1752_07281 [Acaryochloris thomasi RCC1774]
MTISNQWSSPLLFAALLIGASGIQPATAQRITNPVIQGFLGSQNSRKFFKQGRIKLEQEIQRLEQFEQISLEQLLQVNPDASIEDQEIQELESMGQRKRKRDR